MQIKSSVRAPHTFSPPKSPVKEQQSQDQDAVSINWSSVGKSAATAAAVTLTAGAMGVLASRSNFGAFGGALTSIGLGAGLLAGGQLAVVADEPDVAMAIMGGFGPAIAGAATGALHGAPAVAVAATGFGALFGALNYGTQVYLG